MLYSADISFRGLILDVLLLIFKLFGVYFRRCYLIIHDNCCVINVSVVKLTMFKFCSDSVREVMVQHVCCGEVHFVVSAIQKSLNILISEQYITRKLAL